MRRERTGSGTSACPPEVHQWLEYFVLAHFIPEKRLKRKRDNWKNRE